MIVAQNSDCGICHGRTFNPNISSTNNIINLTMSNRAYGSANLTGSIYSDIVCLQSDICASPIDLFLVSGG